jgi:hypothetical protein
MTTAPDPAVLQRRWLDYLSLPISLLALVITGPETS